MLAEIWDSLSGRTVRPFLSSHKEFPVSDDADRETVVEQGIVPDWHQSVTSISGVPIIIKYRDSKGELSERLITCQRLEKTASTSYLWAFCHTRHAIRKFIVQRISEITDPETGECHREPFAFFEQLLNTTARYKDVISAERSADLLALINVIVFIAKCDRDYHKLERSMIETSLVRFWLHLELAGEPDLNTLMQYADKIAPDAATFWASAQRCVNDRKLTKIMSTSAREIIEADGVIQEEEFYWGTKLDELIRAMRPV